jgi:hypothetical protein
MNALHRLLRNEFSSSNQIYDLGFVPSGAFPSLRSSLASSTNSMTNLLPSSHAASGF